MSDVTRPLDAIHRRKSEPAKDPQAAHVVKLRYFLGMTVKKAAGALGLSLRTVERLRTHTPAWLRREISG